MDELDHELLISCTAGLGCWMEDKNGNIVYCKTDDCVGEVPFATYSIMFMLFWHVVQSPRLTA